MNVPDAALTFYQGRAVAVVFSKEQALMMFAEYLALAMVCCVDMPKARYVHCAADAVKFYDYGCGNG